MSISEIATLRQRINDEIEASRLALQGFAVVSSHEIITQHYEQIGACLEELTSKVGQTEAIRIIIEQLERGL